MAKAWRVCLGLGVLALGLCAALPFRRHDVVGSPRPASGVPSAGLKVRGEDAPASTLQAAHLLAMESSHPAGNGNASPQIAGRDANAANAGNHLPAVSMSSVVGHPNAIPQIAETFDQAVAIRSAANSELAKDTQVGPPLTAETLALAANGAAATNPVRLGAPVAVPSGSQPAAASGPIPSEGSAANAPSGQLATELAPVQPWRRHRIRDGDTLPDLARRYLHDAARSSEIFEANRQILSRPDVLPLGEVLQIPPGP